MNFCGKCGTALTTTTKPTKTTKQEEQITPHQQFQPVSGRGTASNLQDERKLVTVMFADISGFTAMSEKMDPEQVRDMMNACFEHLVPVVTKYEGMVDKFIGDEIMALFGAPVAHEDDPERALRAALEMLDALLDFNATHGTELGIHFGINTGLVLAGSVGTSERQDYSVMGDTVNLAARLEDLSERGQIFVGLDTYRATNHIFVFQEIGLINVKGKTEPVPVYQVLSVKEGPTTARRPPSLRANLIGRKIELSQLTEGVTRLKRGERTIISLCGDAGTGKSRLLEEFKASLDLEQIQWLESNAYAYSQNIPYFPLIHLFNQIWQIESADPPEKVREKIESGIENLLGKRENIVPYIGSLYALSYPQVEDVSPEFWKGRLIEGTKSIFEALTNKTPTVICFEDLHWADPSTIDLLRSILPECRFPALFLCVYRPTFSLFTGQKQNEMGELYRDARLTDFSPSETQKMVESLLHTKTIPSELSQLIQEKGEGNPFYLEEIINSLIESDILTRDNSGPGGIGMFHWRLTKPIDDLDVPPTVQGVISARLDRLNNEMKQILQEASVIGREFFYQILNRVTELEEHIDCCLNDLEEIDLIKVNSLQPDIEYIFKHALTQEVAYNRLLKQEKQVIHKKIALVMEQLFADRLPEFYETLAFHFKQTQSLHKAVDYLVKSGEKSMNRYSVEESHQYFKEAFDLLTNKTDKTKEEQTLLIALLNKWALVFYYRGDFRGLEDLLTAHESLAESLSDKEELGMFYAWLGMSVYFRAKLKDSYQYLRQALELGEKIENQRVIGYACTWLTWPCATLGLFDEAIAFGERALEISRFLEYDQYLYFKPRSGIGFTYYWRGEAKKAFKFGKTILDYGKIHSHIRSMSFGHWIMGLSYFADGDFPSSIESCQRGIQVAVDPFYSASVKVFSSFSYISNGQFQEAGSVSQEVLTFSQNFGVELIGTLAKACLGVVSIAQGDMTRGLKMLQEAQQICLEQNAKPVYAICEYMLGKVYLQVVQKAAPLSFSIVVKNIGFLVKNVPFASKKAEKHFKKAIEVAEEIGAKSMLGTAYLDLSLLYKTKRKKDKARECISRAIGCFEECEAETYLKQAKEALGSLG